MDSKNLMANLSSLVEEISGNTKTAQVKTAEPTSEAGGLDGGSSHPVAKADDGLTSVSTGSRAAENTSTVKNSIGPASVDSTPEAKPGDSNANDSQSSVGTKKTLSGDDPATEDNYKDKKDEPGNIDGKATTHPATVGAEKFGSLSLADKTLELSKQANDLLRTMVQPKSPAAAAADPVKTAAEAQQAVTDGYNAAAVGGLSDAQIQQMLGNTIKEAEYIGDLAGQYLASFSKAAADADDANSAEDHNKAGDASTGATPGADNGASGGGSGAPGTAGGGDEAALMAAMAGGGGAAPAAPPAAPGPDAAAAGGDPMNELFNALVEMGITPDELHALADKLGGGGVGGLPGAGDPAMAQKVAMVKQAALNVKKAARCGKTCITEAKTAGQRQLRQQFKSVLAEFVG